jgi:hypothetical protein
MGSKSKSSGGGGTSSAGGTASSPQYSYGGQTTSQADAEAKYKADLAAWRAPTTTGRAPSATPVPTTATSAFGSDGGPALPSFGVAPTAPTASSSGYNPNIQQQFLMAMGADPRTVLGNNYQSWASTPVTRGTLAAQMGSGHGPRLSYGSKNSRYQAGGR